MPPKFLCIAARVWQDFWGENLLWWIRSLKYDSDMLSILCRCFSSSCHQLHRDLLVSRVCCRVPWKAWNWSCPAGRSVSINVMTMGKLLKKYRPWCTVCAGVFEALWRLHVWNSEDCMWIWIEYCFSLVLLICRRTPLHWATVCEQPNIIRLLLVAGGKPTAGCNLIPDCMLLQ